MVLLSLLTLAVLGRLPDSQAGWVICPPQMASFPPGATVRRSVGGAPSWRLRLRCCGHYLCHHWRTPPARSLLLAGLWPAGGRQGPGWVVLVPQLVTGSQAVRAVWPELGRWGCWLPAIGLTGRPGVI
ncbi:MAG: hypothetical protein ACP5OO_00445 [Chloroflexia bacterium]